MKSDFQKIVGLVRSMPGRGLVLVAVLLSAVVVTGTVSNAVTEHFIQGALQASFAAPSMDEKGKIHPEIDRCRLWKPS